MKLEIESRHSDYGPDAGGYTVLRLDGKYVGRIDDDTVGEKLVKEFNELTAKTKQYEFLDEAFLTLMNDIGRYGQEKYGADSFHSRAQTGDRSRSLKRTQKEEILRHIREHTAAYAHGELHDKFGDLDHQLAAAAFNCLMEYYFSKGE